MSHEDLKKTDARPVSSGDSESPLESAVRYVRGITGTVSGTDGESRADRSTREGRSLWRWAQETGRRVEASDYLDLVDGGGQEHRVWHDLSERRYHKVTHAGRYGWIAMMDWRYNKRTQEDEPYIGMGDATPLEYLVRLQLQNEVFADDIQLKALAIEAEGLAIWTTQPFVRGRMAKPSAILESMLVLGFERIPGIPANSEDCFSFYRREDRVAAFDAHTGNYVRTSAGLIVPIDLVMVRADDAFHDYTCTRIDASAA